MADYPAHFAVSFSLFGSAGKKSMMTTLPAVKKAIIG
jgi:hypothetical protein